MPNAQCTTFFDYIEDQKIATLFHQPSDDTIHNKISHNLDSPSYAYRTYLKHIETYQEPSNYHMHIFSKSHIFTNVQEIVLVLFHHFSTT